MTAVSMEVSDDEVIIAEAAKVQAEGGGSEGEDDEEGEKGEEAVPEPAEELDLFA